MTALPPSSPTDADLLAAFARDRSQQAFALIVNRHAGMVLAVCRSVLHNHADAEDAAQAVFLTLARKPHLRHACLAGWLHRVAWYIASRAAEARAIRQRHEKEAAAMKTQSPTDPPVSLELLHAALAKLPEKYRIPLLLHHLEGRTQEETAALLGCRTSAVAMRLNRGRQMLRDRMSHGREPVADTAVAAALVPSVDGQAASPNFVATAALAASLAASHQLASATVLSTSTLALSKGALNMLFWTKVKLVAAMIALVLMTGGAVGTYVALAQPAPRHAAAADNPTGPFLISGTIAAIDANSISVTQRGQTTRIPTNAATVFKLEGQPATAADLKTGLAVGVWGTAGKPAVEIHAFTPKAPASQPASQPASNPASPFLMSGTIAAIDATSISVTHRGQTTKIATNAATVYQLDSKPATVADLKVGLAVGVWGTAGKPAVEIHVFTPKSK